MKYRNRIPEPGTTISGFADSKKKKKINADHPRLFWHVPINTNIFLLALQWPELWKISENKTQYQIWKER